MGVCEKCWADAYIRAFGSSKSQYDCYLEILKEREDSLCSLEEQKGECQEESEREG